MQITLSAVDLALALARQGESEFMVVLAVRADADMEQDGAIAGNIAARHNGSAYHAGVAAFLRRLADAIDGQSTT